jgi:hypothetical protein
MLSGTLETIQRLPVRNLGPGGALIESTASLSVGSRLTGRLLLNGQSREVKAEVRHATTKPLRSESARYLVGIEWVDVAAPLEGMIFGDPVKSRRQTSRPGPERRQGARMKAKAGAEISRPSWTTVELVDISTSGVLFVVPQGIGPGDRGQLRIRLGDKGFAGEIEVLRVHSDRAGLRAAAVFTTLDEASRTTLEEFIGSARQ